MISPITPNTTAEIARRFSTYEATQFINGILDAIKRDLDEQQPQQHIDATETESETEPETESEELSDEHSASA